MTEAHWKIIFGIALFLFSTYQGVNGQVITTGKDSTVVRLPDDSVSVKGFKGWSDAGKAAFLSAVIPGLGQAYNKSYWKIPIIYAGGIGLGYALYTNHHQYLKFRKAYQLRTDNDSTTVDEFVDKYKLPTTLSRGRDQYRRWRDLTILYTVLAHGLNITEAYVHAHLKDFDISDELTMQVQPTILQATSTKFIPAFTLSFNLKK